MDCKRWNDAQGVQAEKGRKKMREGNGEEEVID
jgi:hypothetical protein